jgi:hypothetical protein
MNSERLSGDTPHGVSTLIGFLNANGFSTRLLPGRDILIAEKQKQTPYRKSETVATEYAQG